MLKDNKPLWKLPWGYGKSIMITTAILVVGFILQIMNGCINYQLFSWPANGWFGLAIVLITIFFGVFFKHSKFTLWLSGTSFSICLIATILFLSLIMGLTPQITDLEALPDNWVSLWGFNRMASSWPFALLYFTLLCSLGILVIRFIFPFKPKKIPFYLNHLGLWLVLMSIGLGASDLKKYIMYVKVKDKNPECRVYNDKNELLELPIAIYLNKFQFEQYPPKLALIENSSGKFLPINNPQYLELDTMYSEGNLLEWNIKVELYLPNAVKAKQDSYQEIPMPGSAPAAKVRIINKIDGYEKTGWVSCGSFAQVFKKISLDDTRSLIMTIPEPRYFASHVVIYSKYSNKPDTAIIEVNRPFEKGSWSIYQYSYDEKMGKESTYSSFELVYDPWKNLVFFSFALLAAGSISLFWQKRNRKVVKK
jgi:hypothetical protein